MWIPEGVNRVKSEPGSFLEKCFQCVDAEDLEAYVYFCFNTLNIYSYLIEIYRNIMCVCVCLRRQIERAKRYRYSLDDPPSYILKDLPPS